MRAWALLLCALLVSGAARAEDYPSKSIRLIVPFAAGGAVGAVARVLATPLSASLGQSIVIDNRGGAGGIIGMDAMAKAPPDGYTLLLIHSGITYMPGLYRKLPFDPTADFDGVIAAVSGSYVLAVTNSAPFKTVGELIAYAKANPGKLSYGSAGVGSASHLAAELLKSKAGIEMVHVPNKGMNPALIDLMGGQVQVLFASVPGLTSEKTERARPIAMAELKRSALMPELPTMSESGLPGFAVGNWAGLLGPADLDAAIVKKLHDEVLAILAKPDMKARIKTLGFDVIASTPEEFAKQLQEDIARWGPVAKTVSEEKK